MKKLLMCLIMLSIIAGGIAADRKALKDVDPDSFTSDTQVSPKGAGDDHAAIVWWIPHEFWKSILARDNTMSYADKQAMLDAMAGISLMAVVQADITSFGAFQFYTKDEIEQKMTISFTNAEGKRKQLSSLKTIDPNLEVVLGVFTPTLGAAMGNLGKNLHFYVLDDESYSGRIIDPYKTGEIGIELTRRDGKTLNTTVALPINALFVPRKCPNGRDAHITWKYCPWTGKKLAD